MDQNILPSVHEISQANTQSIIRIILWGFLIAYLVMPFLVNTSGASFETVSQAESERTIQRVFGFDGSFIKLILTSDTSASGDIDAKMALSKLADVGFVFPKNELLIESTQRSFMVRRLHVVQRSEY